MTSKCYNKSTEFSEFFDQSRKFVHSGNNPIKTKCHKMSTELVIEDIPLSIMNQEFESKPAPFEAWYSPGTISTIVKEITSQDDGKSLVAFISSSPSLYFALNGDLKKRARIFDVGLFISC